MGEAAKQLMTGHPKFVQRHSAVPWEKLVGMPNRIAHGYTMIDMAIVWKTVTDDVHELLIAAEPLIAAYPPLNDFTA